MKLQELQTLIKAGDIDKIISVLETARVVKNIENTLKFIDPKKHDVMNEQIRKDVLIKRKDGGTEIRKVARLPLDIQNYIIDTATAYLGVPELDLASEVALEKEFVTVYKKIWSDNKMDYKFKNLVRKTKGEKESALLIYPNKAEPEYWKDAPIRPEAPYKFRMKVLAKSLGDNLLPCFDEQGDMVAFGHGYKIFDIDNVEIEYFDLYMADQFIYTKRVNGTWQFSIDRETFEPAFTKGYPNTIGKIPLIYFWQPRTDTENVDDLITALEFIISNHNDTNRKLGSPIIFAEGDVQGFPDEGETGKVLIGKNGAKVSYLTWNSAPESIKMEIENLLKFIFMLTRTPDTSLDKLLGLGYFSTVALKTLFQDPHIKAAASEEIYGEGQQRFNNYMKLAVSILDPKFKPILKLELKPKFTYFLPSNDSEAVTTINSAVSGGVLSRDSGVRLMPKTMVGDPQKEIDLIKAEEKEEADNQAKIAAQNKVGFPVN